MGTGGAGTISRRRLLVGGAAVAGLAALGPGRLQAWALPVPGPDRAASRVLRAYVATLVPGPGDDPTGTPGGVEAGGVESILEHAPYVVPLLVADLTSAALAAHGKPFEALAYPQREALVVQAFADGARLPYHLIVLSLAAGAFYADYHAADGTRVGGEHLGFPGPSDGYLGTYTDRTGHGQPQRAALTP